MKKFIPLTLTAVLAIAMVFAIAPSDYASTTHAAAPATGTVTSASILDGTIASGDILDATIVAGDIAANGVTSAALADAIALPTSITVGNAGSVLADVAAGASGVADGARVPFGVTFDSAPTAVICTADTIDNVCSVGATASTTGFTVAIKLGSTGVAGTAGISWIAIDT